MPVISELLALFYQVCAVSWDVSTEPEERLEGLLHLVRRLRLIQVGGNVNVCNWLLLVFPELDPPHASVVHPAQMWLKKPKKSSIIHSMHAQAHNSSSTVYGDILYREF